MRMCAFESVGTCVCACVQHCREFLKADQKIYTHTRDPAREPERQRRTSTKRERACERVQTISVTKRERETNSLCLACISSADLQLQWKNKTKQQVNLN